MSFCTTTLLSIAKSCDSNYGGLKRVLLASAGDVPVSGVTFDADMEITGITSNGGGFVEWNFENQEASDATLTVTDTIVMNKRLDLQKVDLVININKLNKASRKALEAVKNKDLVALVLDENSVWQFIGYSMPLRKSAKTYTSGSQRNAGDNAYSITFTCEEKNEPFTVSNDAALAAIA